MEPTELNTILRQIDQDDRPVPVDTLVDEGIRRGRRRLRSRRLTAVGALGAALATASAVVAFGMTANSGVTIAPAATPTPKPSPSASTEPAPKDKGTMPTTAELQKIIRAYVPDDLTMRKVVPNIPGAISFDLGDEDGYGWASGGVARTAWYGDVPCTEKQGCTSSKIDGGELRIYRDTEKVGDGTWYEFRRDDGTQVAFAQRNAYDGNGPATRDQLAMTDKQVIKLITAVDWQKVTDRLPKEASVDDKQIDEDKAKKSGKKPR